MRRAALLLTLLALVALGFAPAPLPKPERRGRPAGPSMEGLWRRTSGDTVRITATTWTNRPETARTPTFGMKIDPRASPGTFDMSTYGTTTLYLLGIYKIEGDVLTICYNSANLGRPTAFDGPGKGSGTEVFTRAR